jgi:3-oxoacyl-[acyl-carrier protein] reductase
MARERTLLLTGFDSEIASDIVEAFAFDEAYDIALTFSEQTEFAVEESDRLKEITEGRVRVIKCDLADTEQVDRMVMSVASEFGSIDTLVTTGVGVHADELHSMANIDLAAVMQTTYYSAFNVIRAVLPHMRDREWGRIISLLLPGSQAPISAPTISVQSAASQALASLLRSAAVENASSGITINGIAVPVLAQATEANLEAYSAMIPIGRLPEVSEITSLVRYLAGTEAAYITGNIISLTGGLAI